MRTKIIWLQEKLRNDLKQKRQEVLFQMKHQGDQTKALESEIYQSGCMLRKVMDENHKLDEVTSSFILLTLL